MYILWCMTSFIQHERCGFEIHPHCCMYPASLLETIHGVHWGFPHGSDGKESACNVGHPRFRKIPWRREWQPTPVFLPGESHGQRSLVGYSPWGCKELDTNEWLMLLLFTWRPLLLDFSVMFKEEILPVLVVVLLWDSLPSEFRKSLVPEDQAGGFFQGQSNNLSMLHGDNESWCLNSLKWGQTATPSVGSQDKGW